MRTWIRRISAALVVVAVVIACIPLATILPLVRDDLTLDRIVVAVALDWRDFGLDKANQRLQYELDFRSIGPQLDERDCVLKVDEQETRTVACTWEVRVDLGWFDAELPLAFASVAAVDRHGVLQR